MSLVLLIIGVLIIISAVIDLFEGFGILYAAVLFIIGLIFLAVSGRV